MGMGIDHPLRRSARRRYEWALSLREDGMSYAGIARIVRRSETVATGLCLKGLRQRREMQKHYCRNGVPTHAYA